MIRYGRRNEVVPVVERVVEDDLSGEPCLPPGGTIWLKSSTIPLETVFGEHPKALHTAFIELPAGPDPDALHAIKCLLSRSLSVARYSISALLISTGGFFFISVTLWKSVTKIRKFLQLFYIKILIINEIYHFFSNPVANTSTSLHLIF